MAQTDVGNFRVPDVDENGVLKSIMTGENATMFPDKPMEVEGLVIEFYEKDGETVSVRLTSPGCQFDTRSNYATSDKAVEIVGNDFTVDGVGYKFDSNTSRMEILSEVQVVFKNTDATSPRNADDTASSDTSPSPAPGPGPSAVSQEKSQFTEITSETLFFNYEGKQAIFTGDVVLNDSDLQVTANMLTVFLTAEDELDRLEAEGNVEIRMDTIRSRSGNAVYTVTDGKLVLTVKPVVYRNESRLHGEEIIYWHLDKRLEAREARSRFFQKKDS